MFLKATCTLGATWVYKGEMVTCAKMANQNRQNQVRSKYLPAQNPKQDNILQVYVNRLEKLNRSRPI